VVTSTEFLMGARVSSHLWYRAWSHCAHHVRRVGGMTGGKDATAMGTNMVHRHAPGNMGTSMGHASWSVMGTGMG
jgi:hypothetical protein